MKFWKLVQVSALAALAIFACLLAWAAPGGAALDPQPTFISTPGGERLAFVLDDGQNMSIVSARPDGIGAKVLAQEPVSPGIAFPGIAISESSRVLYAKTTALDPPDPNNPTDPGCRLFSTPDEDPCFDYKVCQASQVSCLDFPKPVSQLTLSPDGTRTALETKGEIRILDTKRQVEIDRISDLNASPSTFTSGNALVYIRYGALMIKAAGGGSARQLTSPPTENQCFDISSPVWRPIAGTVVFSRFVHPACQNDFGPSGIWQVSASGAGMPTPELLVGTTEPGVFLTDPVSSRDGKQIAFVEHREQGDLRTSTIHILDEGGERAVTPATSNLQEDTAPAFSGNGDMIAFERSTAGIDPSIYTVGRYGANLKPFTAKTRLRVALDPKSIRVEPGKRRLIDVSARNEGQVAAEDVKICLAGPRRLAIFGKKCVKFDSPGDLGIAAGTGVARAVGLRIRRKVKPGQTFRLTCTVHSSNAASRSAVLKVRVSR